MSAQPPKVVDALLDATLARPVPPTAAKVALDLVSCLALRKQGGGGGFGQGGDVGVELLHVVRVDLRELGGDFLDSAVELDGLGAGKRCHFPGEIHELVAGDGAFNVGYLVVVSEMLKQGT